MEKFNGKIRNDLERNSSSVGVFFPVFVKLSQCCVCARVQKKKMPHLHEPRTTWLDAAKSGTCDKGLHLALIAQIEALPHLSKLDGAAGSL